MGTPLEMRYGGYHQSAGLCCASEHHLPMQCGLTASLYAGVVVTSPEPATWQGCELVDAEEHSLASPAVSAPSDASSLPCLQPDFNESMVIPLAQMPYSQAGQTYVVLERAGGALAFGKFANILNFTVKEIDPTTGEYAACPCKPSAFSLLACPAVML